jgi:hypothetical protein
MLDGIKKLSGSESEGPLKNLLDEIERRKYIGDPDISPSMLDSALEEIGKRKANGESVDKFLDDALNEMKTTGAFGQNNARSRAGRPTGAAAPKKEGQQNFAGYSFEKVKPEGWDLMSLEDKENWLATSSSTAKLAARDRKWIGVTAGLRRVNGLLVAPRRHLHQSQNQSQNQSHQQNQSRSHRHKTMTNSP